jgi:two-component system, sensor histidine kinase ChiS
MGARAATLLCLALLGASAFAHAQTQSPNGLDECRRLRHAEPARALEACEGAAQSLQQASNANAAFEAWMHAAEAASQRGDAARADAALERGTALLAQVSDPLAAPRVARRRALNAYRDQRPLDALRHFLEALAAARASGDRGAIAISENDLGVVYRHLGDYPAALAHFEASLRLKEALGESDLGSTLANVGSLQRELGETARAREFLQRALEQHRSAGKPLLEAQTLEELARLAPGEAARTGLEQAWRLVDAADSPRDQLRVALHRAEFEADAGRVNEARAWLARAQRLAHGLGRDDPLQALLAAARLARDDAERRRLYSALDARLSDARSSEEPARMIEARAMLSRLAEAYGDTATALAQARRHQDERAAFDRMRHGERLDALRIRFELAQLEAERDRLVARGALQQSDLERQRARTWTVASIALFALALLALFSQHRLGRQRLRAQVERAALEARIVQARQAADGLRSDLRSLTWLLDRQHVAALIFDAGQRVRALTAGATARLPPAAVHAGDLAAAIGSELAAWAQHAVESASLEDRDATQSATRPFAPGIVLRCLRIALEEELGVLLFEDAPPVAAAIPPALAQMPAAAESVDDIADAQRGDFRARLVALMQACLECWERGTRKGRIDLAEASGIWRITIDDGRLRVRALDRYLALDTLPEHPRWREVLRTAYFVLAELDLGPPQRQRLESLVDAVLSATRRAS